MADKSTKTTVTRECLGDMPQAIRMGELEILNHKVACAVLDDGRRVLSDRGMRAALAIKKTGTRKNTEDFGSPEMPLFLSQNNLKPFIPKDFSVRPISYLPVGNGPVVNGYDCHFLPRVCRVYTAARRAGKLHKSQEHIAEMSEILLEALAETGITALIDEATGHQADRERDALQRMFNRYLRDNFAAWSLTFYPDFYKRLFALRGWKWNPENPACGPRYLAALTKDLIYSRLEPGLLEELERRNPITEDEEGKRRREAKHHQLLTEDVGRTELDEHLRLVMRLMKNYPDWHLFYRMLDRVCPKAASPSVQLDFGDLPDLDLFGEAA